MRDIPVTVKACGPTVGDRPFEPLAIERREPSAHDVRIDIALCGVSHSDLQQVRGDLVGAGCMVDSCQHCAFRAEGLEQYCENGFTATYNSATFDAPGHMLGGYAQTIVVVDRFALKINHPEEQLAAGAIQDINAASGRMQRSDVKYHFVIDNSTLDS